MLGEQVSEFNGKITNQRVLDVEGPTMETSVAASGNLMGLSKVTSNGILHGVGNGIVMTADGEMATYTGEGIGRIDSTGSINWRGSIFCKTSSNGKLAFINNLVGVFEAQSDANGNFSDKTWEWK
ncbi:MAG: hypothetical protein WA421_00240 [Nitrososphaeraceae archaeon]